MASTQGFDTRFSISDFVNFDFDYEVPDPTVDSNSRNLVVDSLQNMSIEGPFAGFTDAVDTEFASVYGRRSALDNDFNPTTTAAVTNALNPASEDFDMVDGFQTTNNTNATLDNFAVFEETHSVSSIDPAALEMPRLSPKIGRQEPPSSTLPILETRLEPSRWVPVSPQLQKQLNTVYASQLSLLANDPDPPLGLYVPAGESSAYPLCDIQSPIRNQHKQTDLSSRLRVKTIKRPNYASLLMQRRGAIHPWQRAPNGMVFRDPPRTDAVMSSAGHPNKKRALHANDFRSGAPKRSNLTQAEILPTAAKDGDSDHDDAEPMTKRIKTARPDPLPAVANDEIPDDKSNDESEADADGETYVDDSSDLPSNPQSPSLPPTAVPLNVTSGPLPISSVPRSGLNWRYEQQHEAHLRDQRRRQWNRRHTSSSMAKGKAVNRRIQKLLEEIEDTREFAEARGYEVGENMGGNATRGRPVRRGSRQSYRGQA